MLKTARTGVLCDMSVKTPSSTKVSPQLILLICGGVVIFSLSALGIYKLTSGQNDNSQNEENSKGIIQPKNELKESSAASFLNIKKENTENNKEQNATKNPSQETQERKPEVTIEHSQRLSTESEPTNVVASPSEPKEKKLVAKISALEHTRFSHFSKCQSQSAAFCEAHMEFINVLNKIFETERKTDEDAEKMDATFLKAKGLIDSTAKADPIFARVYSVAESRLAGCFLFEDSFNMKADALQEELVNAEENTKLRLCYDSHLKLRLVGIFLARGKLTFQNYSSEMVSFINQIYDSGEFSKAFDSALRFHIIAELEKPAPSEDQLRRIVTWAKSFQLMTYPEEFYSTKNDYFARDVRDVASAKKFALYPLTNKLIMDYRKGNATVKQQCQNDYQRYKIGAVYNFPETMSELVSSYFTSGPFFPVSQAVLSTKPRPLKWDSSCYVSSYFQSITNFLPLFQRLPGKDHPGNGPIVKEHLEIMEKVSKPVAEPLNLMPLISWPENPKLGGIPMHFFIRFHHDIGSEKQAMNKVFGINTLRSNDAFLRSPNDSTDLSENYFPSHFLYVDTYGFPTISQLCMTGQLLVIYAHRTKDELYEPFELPFSINLKVTDSDKPKRFELYSFIMGIKMGIPHVVSYVRRADNHWWLCDDLGSKVQSLSPEEVPITAEKQRMRKPPQRPIMAFYLRTEA